MDFWINITTYRREKHLRRLLNQIDEYGAGYSIDGLVIIDHCPYNPIKNWRSINMRFHHGRQNFFKIMNLAFDEMRNKKFKYYLNLQDDVVLKPGFFDKCVELWEGIEDEDKITLDLRRDERTGRSQWGVYHVEKIGNSFKSQWMDLIFMSDARFKKYVPNLDFCNIDSSSGVARQLTKRFRKKGLNMYHADAVLLHHGQIPSLMNPEIRKKEKLIC